MGRKHHCSAADDGSDSGGFAAFPPPVSASAFASRLVAVVGLPVIAALALHWVQRPSADVVVDRSPSMVEVRPKGTSPDNNRARDDDSSTTDECRLYLAESSIPNAGLGVYTAVDLPKHAPVGTPDVVHHILDVEFHNDYAEDLSMFTKDYSWGTMRVGGAAEALRVRTIAPGLGMLGNCHFGLANIEHGLPEIDSAGLHRKTNPGAGAFSYYHNLPHRTTTFVEAGSELFHNYGTKWFKSREDRLGKVPFRRNYMEADQIVRNVSSFAEKHKLSYGEDMMIEMWSTIRRNGSDERIKTFRTKYEEKLGLGLLDEIVTIIRSCAFDDPRTRVALPLKAADLERAAAVGTARHEVPNSVRTKDWLQQNGICVDNLKAGRSTIPEAGRGAFATRFIPAGSVIAPLPLIHVVDRKMLDMYYTSRAPYNQRKKKSQQKQGKQLLLNYCFGHKNSTMLLLPYSSGVGLVNHERNSQNSILRWSKTSAPWREWLNMTSDELKLQHTTRMMLELIAARDIYPGEEVFMDYGVAWEQTWDRYVENWSPPSNSDDYIAAHELNQMSVPVHEVADIVNNQIGANSIETRCYYERQPLSRDENLGLCDFLPNGPILNATLDWVQTKSYACQWYGRIDRFSPKNKWYPCQIIANTKPRGGNATYLGVLEGLNDDLRKRRLVKDIPLEAITFVDQPYSSDQHLEMAFRHEIALPDDLILAP